MIHKHTAQRRMFQVLVMVAIIALSVNSLTFLRSFDLTSARAQSQDPQVKPVVVYPEAFADSLPASEVPPDLIKNGERKPISPPPLAGPNTSVDGAQESAAAPTTDEYEFPMLPLPKGETSAAASAAPDQGPSLAPDGAAALNGALPANAPQALNMPVALLSFPGNSFQDNLNAGFGNLSPPDTNGDVGPNHYVQMTNLLVRVWDKAGNPLTAPFKLSSLFTPLGGQCAAPDAGDPIVLYDPLADRWLLSQFAFASISSPPYHECIAVSKTGDPTGAYYLYDFVTPGNEFPDYPKLGVWPDAYYMTTNQFLLGGSFDGAGAFAFDRSKMLVGDPSASVIYFNLNLASHPEAIGGMLPSDFDGLIAPPAGRPNTFAYFLATEFGDAIDGLRLFNFHVDFATPLNSTFTERPESPLPVAAFNPISPSGRNDIQQPPPATNSNALDSISDRLMHRLQYRNFGSYESLVTNHTVNISGGTTTSTYRAGVRYYQLTGNGAAFSVAEQATYGPADGNSRWMGSAATDNQGNLAVGFSVSSLTTFPSIHYAGRLASDPPGGLFQGEQSIVDGTGVQRSTGGRWGDYSGLTVDPADDCTFWITNEYYTAASQAASTVGWLTQIGAFRFPACTPAAQGTLQGTVIDAGSNAPVSGALIQVSNGFSASTGAAGAYTRNLAPGTYTATASKFGYQPASATVTIANGAVTVQDFALIPLPVMAADSSAVIGESFPPNGAIDPAETVTVSFSLKNIGPGSTSNLVATLLPTGGVTSPNGPATYGVIAGNGGTGAQPFIFTADPGLACGGALVATLHLQDGAQDLGEVTFTFNLGVKLSILAESFDGVIAPALPAGWSASVATGLSTNNWRTVTTSPDTAPNDAFAPDPSTVHDIRLDSPVFAITSPTAQLTFRNSYATEAGFDGGVLEISIGGGAFTDILAAGGSFASGGYNRTLSTGFSNPLPGRQAWSGSSNGYITTVVNLPPAASGQNVQLRWRMGSDSSVSSTGWRIDSIQVMGGFRCDTNPAPAVSVSPASQTVQYSDKIAPVTISGVDSSLDLPFSLSTQWSFNGGAFAPGLPVSLSTADDGCTQNSGLATCTWTLSGTALTAPGVYVLRATVADSPGASAFQDITITVVPEDARVTYTGLLFTSTACPTCSAATLTLAATVQDISVTPDAAGDVWPGDIRHANVTFVDRDNANAVLCSANVGLVTPGDLQTGAATCNYAVNLGAADSATLRIGIVVNNWYTRNSTVDDTQVTVSRPLSTNFITGGGYLVLQTPSGLKAGDPGSKANFGFNVKYNSSGKNIQGNLNLIVRRTESDGVVHVYQIKSNALLSLTVDPASGQASVTAKATIKDITDPNLPVTLDGNATLQLTMDDNGDPGSGDTLGVTIWNKSGGLWFASNWNGVKTVEQLLGGGNLIVK